MDIILYYIRDNIVSVHYFIYAFVCFFFMFALIGYLYKQKYAKVQIKLNSSLPKKEEFVENEVTNNITSSNNSQTIQTINNVVTSHSQPIPKQTTTNNLNTSSNVNLSQSQPIPNLNLKPANPQPTSNPNLQPVNPQPTPNPNLQPVNPQPMPNPNLQPVNPQPMPNVSNK